ncbi:MAG: fibronectin type III domain-containing protein [Bacteroidia bacterium]
MKKITILSFLAFCIFSKAYADNDTLINSKAAWKYLDNGSDQGTTWKSKTFNDSAWQTGTAQFGYGDGDEATIVSYGPDLNNKFITTYFRKTIVVSNPAQYTSLQLQLLRDDGARVFLNGTNIARSNMPTGTISYTTLAKTNQSTAKENKYYLFSISPSLLVSGNNVIAVEVHQYNVTSDDLGFDLRLIGTFTGCGIPAGLASSNITTSSAQLDWTSVTGAVSYNIQYRIVGAGSWTTGSSTTNSLNISSLSPSSNYEWQVQTVCSSGSGLFSSTANFSTASPSCDIPAGLSSSNITTSSATLGWTVVSGAVSYNVQYRIVGAGSWITATSATNSLNISSLSPASNYEWHVQTSCSSNQSAYSLLNNFTTLTPPPCDAPAGLSVTGITTASATTNWNTASGAINYIVQYRLVGGFWNQVASATTSVNLNGLTSARTYECQVQTVCQFSSSVFSSSVSFTTQQSSGIVTIQRGPYLQMLTPNSIHIRWKTDVATNSRVRFGTDMSYNTIIDSSANVTEHEVKISGLNPDTKCYYSIGSSTIDLQGDPNNYFKTSLATGSIAPFRVWATGDFGNGSSAQDAVRDAYTTYAGNNPANFWIWLGDNAYSTGTETEFTNYVFAKYPTVMKNTPIYPGLGNHDYANIGYQSASALGTNFPYFNLFTCPKNAEAGGVASGSEKYYSYNYGNAHFIELDSYGSLNNSTSTMYTWLQNDLNANTQRWTVVYWHHPPYTMGTHNSDNDAELINMRQNIVPLLESKKVDLVLCGHSHVYERSVLLNGHFGLENTLTAAMKVDASSGFAPYYQKSSPNFTGTVYAVVGVSGQGGTITSQASWPHAAMYSYAKTLYGSMIVDFNNDTLHAKFLTSTGTIYDQFRIVKSGTARNPANNYFEANNNEELSVYPNPFSNETIIRYNLERESPVSIEIYDLTGRKIYSFEYSQIQSVGLHEVNIDQGIFKNKFGLFEIRLRTNSKSLNKMIEHVE